MPESIAHRNALRYYGYTWFGGYMQLDLYILYFFFYSFIGYCCEVAYCSIPAGHLVNRGFLYGPYLPIYGFGAMIVIQAFGRFTSMPILVFLAGMVSTSVLEYFTSWLMEKFFHAKLWDYSTYFANLKGRICLLNSTLFGIMSLVGVYFIHPLAIDVFTDLPTWLVADFSRAILIGMCIDTTASIYKMNAFKNQLMEIRKKRKELEARLDLLQREKPSQAFELLRTKLTGEFEEFRARFGRSSRHILEAFPSITSSNEETRLQLELLKMNLRDHLLKARQKARMKTKARDLAPGKRRDKR
jgi:uncharacterized membrane protein